MLRTLLLSAFALLALRVSAQVPAAKVAERYLLAAANQDRLAHQLQPLRVDDHLALAARLHAYEMVKRRTISHQFAGEAGLAARADEAGARFSLVTENVAEAPNSAQIHDLWMNSAGHRANLLDPAVDAVGIAVLYDRGQFYAVEDFAHIVTRMTVPEQEAAVGAVLAQSGLTLLTGTPEARQTCSLRSGYAGTRQPWYVMRYTSSDISRLPEELNTRIRSGKYRQAVVGACAPAGQTPFSAYAVAVLLYP